MENLIGKKISRLTVLSEEPKRKGVRFFRCRCECGNIKITRMSSLKNGSCKSCGCLQRERAAELCKKKKTHGFSGTRFYKRWKALFNRCYNKNCKRYKDYGGRGIVVCKRWHKFENYRDDMLKDYLSASKKYGENKVSIERINNNKGYTKKNCEFIPLSQQSKNRRPFKLTKKQMLKIRELSKSVKGIDLAKRYNVCRSVISEIKNGGRNYGRI